VHTGLALTLDQRVMNQIVAKMPMRRWGEGPQVAHAVDYLIDAEFVTGTTMFVDGGLSM
jgi:NAD(P)-dependent dehydrogenase (short-subunit alcohol dehydrogenase family)